MVRRRTRATKGRAAEGVPEAANNDIGSGSGSGGLELLTTSGGVAGVVTNGSMMDDQYFASPKRKDCKIDSCLSYCEDEEKHTATRTKSPHSAPAKPRGERGCISGRTIGVPLATRSQTRTIENFFKANSAAKTAHLEKQATDEEASGGSSPSPSLSPDLTDTAKQLANGDGPRRTSQDSPPLTMPLHHHQQQQQQQQAGAHMASTMQDEFIYDLSEDTNDTDNTELSDDAVHSGAMAHLIDFSTHRTSSLRDSHSSRSSTTDNIFLQEPVLTLNVDRAANHASAIKINKSLEIEAIFSSPPLLSAAALNGRFNQIVSLNNGAPGLRESFGFESKSAAQMLPDNDNDNSSCDSGIAIASSVEGHSPLVQARRRKPATPHRIVCPSPIKSAPCVVSPAAAAALLSPSARKFGGAAKDVLSPRKSQRHPSATNSKTRRRLNAQKVKAALLPEEVSMHSRQSADKDDETVTVAASAADIIADSIQNGAAHCKDELENLEEFLGDAPTANSFIKMGASIFEPENHPTAQQTLIKHNPNNNHNQNNHSNNKHTNNNIHMGKSLPKAKAQVPKTMKHQLPQPLSTTNGNRELTDFFPVRRSVRKTKTAVKEEMMRNLEQAVLEQRAEGLKVAHFEGKGRGVIADRSFQRGEFVVEYVGDLISMTEAGEREKRYALDENAGCYMYYFKHKNQQYCIDATVDTGKMGRLVNHSRTGNLITKVVVVKQRPHLILVAKDNIESGEELTYDYGDRSKESLLHHPWLAF